MCTFHGKKYSGRSSPRGLVFKKEDAKGHMQERNESPSHEKRTLF